jgi:hypothetical protein
VEFGTADDQEYEEIVEEYEEEIFVPEEFQEPPVTDTTDHALPKQAPVHNLYFDNQYIYMCDAFTL